MKPVFFQHFSETLGKLKTYYQWLFHEVVFHMLMTAIFLSNLIAL